MKKEFIATLILLFLISFASATIVVNANLQGTYNLGDTITLPIKLVSETNLDTIGQLKVSLLCDGAQINIHDGPERLLSGEEKIIERVIPLIKPYVSNSKNDCKIKVSFGDESLSLDTEFTISDKINIATKLDKSEFSPGETIIIKGDAVKENGETVNGFIEMTATITNTSNTIKTTDTVKNGYFYIEIPLSETEKAGDYTVNINIYEKNSQDEKTNKGYTSEKFRILQIPTSLEILFEEEEVQPGTSVKTKTILHDQTGERIDSLSIITIKNEKNEILEQLEKATDEYLEYAIEYNEPPQEWTVVAISNKLNAETTFKIKENKEVKIELFNETLKITNIGNIVYNDTVLVKIGEEPLYLNITLGIDESKEFTLTAPKGEYEIVILTDGENRLTQSGVTLTGRAIDVKAAGQGVVTIIRHPIAWLFIVAIFAFVVFMFIKKGYQKSIFGYIKSKKKPKNSQLETHAKKFNSLLNFKKNKEKKLLEDISNKAELSLSIKGTKQSTSIICLKIKNFSDIDTSKIQETIGKIVSLSESAKSHIYENGENLFILFSPSTTRTFKNEKTAIELAQKIKKILVEHNRIFKQKLEFGISINQGDIIAKPEKNKLTFMGLGAIMNSAKKIANASEEEILLDEKIKTKLATSLKVEKIDVDGIDAYSIKEIKKLTDNKKFLEGFIERMKNEKKK